MKEASQRVGEPASQPQDTAKHQPRTRHFRELIVWQKSMVLAKAIYLATEKMPPREQYGLTSQMRRSAISVPSNIAEGHGRTTDRGFSVFIAQARGSLFELQTQIELARDLGFLHAADSSALLSQSEQTARLLNGLLKKLKG